MKKRLLLASLLVAVVAVLVVGGKALSPSGSKDSQALPVEFDRHRFSLDDPTSPWAIVNKQRPLQPITFAPSDLVTPDVPLRQPDSKTMLMRQQVTSPLQAMFAAAQTAGLSLMLNSGYRSHAMQVEVYNSEVYGFGQELADQQSARPGYSEHQTGLAVDIEPANHACELKQCFADTPEGKWLAANAHRYGFIIRYPADKQAVTGYAFEPWHLRYVGPELATALHATPQTLEEFFNLSGGATYR